MAQAPFSRILNASDLETTADRLGSYFFAPATMRRFKSRIGRVFPVSPRQGYFVTSERYGEGPRHYRVRSYKVKADGPRRDVIHFDSLDMYETAAQASRAALERAQDRPRTSYSTDSYVVYLTLDIARRVTVQTKPIPALKYWQKPNADEMRKHVDAFLKDTGLVRRAPRVKGNTLDGTYAYDFVYETKIG